MKDDPNLLIHSIKSITDFKEKCVLLSDWLERLHSFALKQYDGSLNSDNSLNDEQINLTSTYNAVLRGFAREGQANLGHKTLQQMHDIDNYNRSNDLSGQKNRVFVEIKTNSYNLVLASCRTQNDITLAIEMLNKMIESMKASKNNGLLTISVPFPDAQSFALVIKALISMTDTDTAQLLAKNYMIQFEESVRNRINEPSTEVHNAYMNLLISRLGRKGDLLSMCNTVLTRLNKQQSGIKANSVTWDLLLKAYSTDCEYTPQNRDANLNSARKIFEEMKTGQKGELSDRSFLYMMQCISYLDENEGRRKQEILSTFKMACQLGFVSADVLKTLKANVSDEEFIGIVGNGRLADMWVANVTTRLVRYTDFTLGGANKNARRKGKSTSNWEKKQRQKLASIHDRKQSKIQKRKLKTTQS